MSHSVCQLDSSHIHLQNLALVKRNRTVAQPIVVQAVYKVKKDLVSELEQSKAECIKDEQLIDAHKTISKYNLHNVGK